MVAADLDAVATDRPVVVTHASGHIMNVNTLALQRAGLSRDTDLDGLVRDAAGEPTGELLGPEAMGIIRSVVTPDMLSRKLDLDAMKRFGRVAQLAGVTTATDLLSDMSDDVVATYEAATADADFPLRLVPAMAGRMFGLEEGIARAIALRAATPTGCASAW